MFILLLLLLISSPLAADQVFDKPLTLLELVDIALTTHPETKQAWLNANRAASVVGASKSLYYPRIDFHANATHGRDFKFINGPKTTYTIVDADLTLGLLLFDSGETREGVNAAKMGLLAAHWHWNWILQKVMIQVLENAYSVLHAQEVLCAAYTSETEAAKMLDVSQQLNRAGVSSISDVYTSQATLAQMRMEVVQQQALLDIQRGKLSASLGLTADIPIQLAPIQELPLIRKNQVSELIELAKFQRADLMAKQARAQESIAILNKTRASYGPKVSLLGRGGANHAFHDKTQGGEYQIVFNLEAPLFTGFESMYQNRIAYADSQMSLEDLAQLELTISLEVLTHSRMLKAAQEMLTFAEDNLENAKKAYEGVLDRYGAGKEGIAEVSNALRQLATARVRYSDVKTRWLISTANLAYATGTLSPYMDKPCDTTP